MKTFISFSAADRAIVEPFVEMLRLHYIDFFYSDRTLKGGYFAEDIEKAIEQCRKFIEVKVKKRCQEPFFVKRQNSFRKLSR